MPCKGALHLLAVFNPKSIEYTLLSMRYATMLHQKEKPDADACDCGSKHLRQRCVEIYEVNIIGKLLLSSSMEL